MAQLLDFKKTESIQSAPLQAGEVHLWWVSLHIDQQLQQAFEQRLSEHQRKKLQRLPSENARRFYIAGRGYLQQLLVHYCDLDPSQPLALEFGEFGKPSLQNSPFDVRFNFTDTCGYGLFAFSISADLGVDLEHQQRQGKFDMVVKRRFAAEEQHLIGQDGTEFLRCWTRKEAYGKAQGTGLNYPLREHVMCSDLSNDEFCLVKEGYYGQQFSIQEGEDGFIACLVSVGDQAKKLRAFHLQTL